VDGRTGGRVDGRTGGRGDGRTGGRADAYTKGTRQGEQDGSPLSTARGRLLEYGSFGNFHILNIN
jgi:hypothetical protein